MEIRSNPRRSGYSYECSCGAILLLDATTEEEARREGAARHICQHKVYRRITVEYQQEARDEKAT